MLSKFLFAGNEIDLSAGLSLLRSTIGERILIGSFPRVYVPRFSDAIKFHGLDAILDWLAAWHIWPRFHVKFFDRQELVS